MKDVVVELSDAEEMMQLTRYTPTTISPVPSMLTIILFSSSENLPILSVYTPPWMQEASKWWSYYDTKSVDIGDRAVHGVYSLPTGYSLAFVPRNATVQNPSEGAPGQEILEEISSSCSLTKAAIGLFQSLYASFTLFD